jgi:hypothetical protein
MLNQFQRKIDNEQKTFELSRITSVEHEKSTIDNTYNETVVK